MRHLLTLLPFVVLPVLGQDSAPSSAAEVRAVTEFARQWCVRCHGGARPAGELDLVAAVPTLPSDRTLLARIRDRVARGEMPPDGEPRPERPARRAFLDATAAWIGRGDLASRPSQADPPAARRLSRTEYENTIRDLCGVSVDAIHKLPPEDAGYGFDNVAGGLTLAPVVFERYAQVAELIAEQAIDAEDVSHPVVRRFDAAGMACSLTPSVRGKTFRVLYSNADLTQKVVLPRDGEYIVRAHAFGDQAGPEPARMTIEIDEKVVATFDVPESRPTAPPREARAVLKGGPRSVSVAFINDYYMEKAPNPKDRDRNLLVEWVEVVGPVDRREQPEFHTHLLASDEPAAAVRTRARRALAPFVTRAWRRPPPPRELDRLADLVEQAVGRGARFEQGIQLALQAVLLSPRFIFRIEGGPTVGDPATGRGVDGWALASRLSYFLWSTLPDARLFALAESGRISETETLRAEVRRMLADARATALATNFAPQWLEIRNLADVTPDARRFPGFDDELRDAMAQEAQLFFEAVLREKRSAWDLVDADFTFVNERLARHYGIPGVRGPHFRRVKLTGEQRGGIITQAGVQTITSNPTRTSPVKRGKWLLDNILGASPPPPPPGAGALDESAAAVKSATMRERLDRHRRDPSCASCHVRMDALGFALENYDPIGRWRTTDEGRTLDVGGKLPDGRQVAGPAELRRVLRSDDSFLRCLASKLFTYALGRPPTDDESLAIEDLVAGLPAESPTMEDLISDLVLLEAFRGSEAR